MTKIKKAQIAEARRLLKRAQEQLDQASVASWTPQEPAECVTNAFYAYENGLMAAARALGKPKTTKHYEKVKLAAALYSDNDLKTDVSSTIQNLNELRKDVQYGEPGLELNTLDLADVVAELEDFLTEVEEIIKDA